MSRISKRKQSVQNSGKEKGQDGFSRVGIYTRISGLSKEKSDSQSAQIEIAKQYIKEKNQAGDHLKLVDIYSDTKKSGSNFCRDEFARMMEDIRLGIINCIIVKDLSRFGRNHIEAGDYIEKRFPLSGVRFIAVTDHFDTHEKEVGSRQLEVNIKNLVHEMYARDFSKKAKLQLAMRREKGEYTGGPPPYGYTFKWIKNNKTLVPDEASDVVRMIYDSFLKGNSYGAVTRLLNEEKINPPAVYKKYHDLIYPDNGTYTYKGWDKGSVQRILKSQTYQGVLVRSKAGFPGKVCHEPVVSAWTFEAVQSMIEQARERTGAGKTKITPVLAESIYDDVLYCGLCRRKMVRDSQIKRFPDGRVKRYESYYCPDSYSGKIQTPCRKNRVSKKNLSHILSMALKIEFMVRLKKTENYIHYYRKEGVQKKAGLQRDIQKTERKLYEFTEEEAVQYIRYNQGILSRDAYLLWKGKNQQNKDVWRAKREEAVLNLEIMEKSIEKQSWSVNRIIDMNSGRQLSRKLINTFVNRIYVYPKKKVEMEYTFNNRQYFL